MTIRSIHNTFPSQWIALPFLYILLKSFFVMNQLDPIKELYDIYLKGEEFPKIVEIAMDDLDFDSDIGDGLADPYLEL